AERHGLVLEAPLPERAKRPAVTFDRKAVLLFPADLEFLGQVLGGASHQLPAKRVGQAFPQAVDEFRVTEPCPPDHVRRHVRRSASFWTGISFRAPPKFPIGVRTPATITTSFMRHLQRPLVGLVWWMV